MATKHDGDMATRNNEMTSNNNGETMAYTFQWKINNVSHCWWLEEGEPSLNSPSFIADALEGTKWSLDLYPMGEEEKYGVGLYLHRKEDCMGPDVIQIKYKLAFLDKDGSALKESTESDTFQKGESCGYSVFQGSESVFVTDRDAYLPEDTLTVQCALWKAEEETFGKCKHLYARTVLNTSRKSFDWRIDKFSTLPSGVKKKFKNDLMEFDLFLKEDFPKRLSIDMIYFSKTIKYFSVNTSVKDLEGKKGNCGIAKYFVSDMKKGKLSSDLIFSKMFLKNKLRYLSNDVLFLEFDVVISTIENFEDSGKEQKNNVTRNESYARQDKYENTAVLIEDFKSMYNDHILSDTELRTSTKTFPAHMAILSARSPVFKRMFSHDMKENNSGHVDIDDLEEDTVHRMLLFIYTGLLEGLQFENASKLYKAADKYQILSMKCMCSSFLIDNLCPTIACDILLLADLHQDEDLKNTVQNYILENDVIFRSQEWKYLMDTNLKLAADIMYRKINPDTI